MYLRLPFVTPDSVSLALRSLANHHIIENGLSHRLLPDVGNVADKIYTNNICKFDSNSLHATSIISIQFYPFHIMCLSVYSFYISTYRNY